METTTALPPKGAPVPPVPVVAKAAGTPPPPPVKPRGPADPAQMAGLLPGEGTDQDQQGENFHHAAGFFNQPWVQNILPLATSLMFHIAIVGIGFALYKTVQAIQNPNREQTIIPESKAPGATKMPGGTPHPGPPADPTRDVAQLITKNTTDDGVNTKPSDSTMRETSGGGAGANQSEFEGHNSHNGKGRSSGGGAGDLTGGGNGGATAPYGTPGGGDGSMLPKSEIYGVGGNADKVVFLVDTSGSMIGVIGDVKSKLKSAINTLHVGGKDHAVMQFNIIMFSDESDPRTCFKGGMALATEANKKIALDFVDDAVASGGTLPMPAIKKAFSQNPRPQLMYVMTDGFDNVASFDEVINAFKDGTKDGYTHVNCIQFQGDDPDVKLEDVLRTISKNGNGKYISWKKSDMQ
jgi:hypothetical protein